MRDRKDISPVKESPMGSVSKHIKFDGDRALGGTFVDDPDGDTDGGIEALRGLFDDSD